MSYILDALKKAEAERHIGELPGIGSQPQAALRQRVELIPVWKRPKVIVPVLMLAALTGATGGWYLFAGKAPQQRAPDAAARVAMPGPLASTGGAAPAPWAPVTLAELPVPPMLPKPPSTAPRNASVAIVLPNPAAGPAAPSNSLRPAMAPAAPANIPTLSQLPTNLRGELPPLAISGSMYSSNPADRMLLVDKRMLHEGDEIAPGLVLESILPKGAVLRYKGIVFRM